MGNKTSKKAQKTQIVKNCQKRNINFQNVLKNDTKKRKIVGKNVEFPLYRKYIFRILKKKLKFSDYYR